MVNTFVSAPMSHRGLMKVFLCVLVFATTGVETGGSASNGFDHEVETAVKLATAPLHREIDSLKDELEFFEMKHETLQAASEHFRVQSKNAKSQLDEERRRYEILASEKRSLETNIESRLANALELQKANFEDTIAAEHIEKQKLLAKEIQELGEKLRLSEYKLSRLEGAAKKKIQEGSKEYELLAAKKNVTEGKLRGEIADLRKRLSFSEEQAKSFEDSWKKIVAESERKDKSLEKESEKRVKEASRWEERMQKIKQASEMLLNEKQAKEGELIESEKRHKELLNQTETLEKAIEQYDAKLALQIAENQRLANDLNSTAIELAQSKKTYAGLVDDYEGLRDLHEKTEITLTSIREEQKENVAKRSALENELVDVLVQLETSQNKNQRLANDLNSMAIELAQSKKTYAGLVDDYEGLRDLHEKTEITLTSIREEQKENVAKRSALENELVDVLVQLETSQNKTKQLIEKTSETTKAYTLALEELSSKNDVLRNEVVDVKFELEISHNETQSLMQRIDEVSVEKDKMQTKLLAADLNAKKSKETFERTVQDLKEDLDSKNTKNSYLQRTLLLTKEAFEDLQTEVKRREEQNNKKKLVDDEQKESLETENKEIAQRVKVLEQELEKASYLYDGVSREVHSLKGQLKTSESRSVELSRMYETMKQENDILTRNLRAAEKELGDFKSSLLVAASLAHNRDLTNQKVEVDEDNTESSNSLDHDVDIDLEASETESVSNSQAEVIERDVKGSVVGEKEGSTDEDIEDKASETESVANPQIEVDESHVKGSAENDGSIDQDINEKKSETESAANPQAEIDESDVKGPVVVDNEGSIDQDIKAKARNETEPLIQENATAIMEGETLSEDDSVDADISSQKSTRTESESKPSTFFKQDLPVLRWLKNAFYQVPRVIVDSLQIFTSGVWKIALRFGIEKIGILFKPLLTFVSWAANELRIIHYALVSLFEFEMTFVSSLLSSEKDRTGFAFLIRHSEIVVMFGEIIAALLGIDFIISSFINPRRIRKRRPRARTIEVPKSATTSLLRKANNM